MGYSPSYRPTQGRGYPEGGITAVTSATIYPGLNANGTMTLNAFDPSAGYDDQNDGGFHYFRVEEVQIMRAPTFRRVGIIYRDLGIATIQIALSAVNDNGAIVTNQLANGQYPSFTIGTTAASQRLCQKLLDTRIMGSLPQMGIIRAAGAGPVSISKMWLTTEVEQTTL